MSLTLGWKETSTNLPKLRPLNSGRLSIKSSKNMPLLTSCPPPRDGQIWFLPPMPVWSWAKKRSSVVSTTQSAKGKSLTSSNGLRRMVSRSMSFPRIYPLKGQEMPSSTGIPGHYGRVMVFALNSIPMPTLPSGSMWRFYPYA